MNRFSSRTAVACFAIVAVSSPAGAAAYADSPPDAGTAGRISAGQLSARPLTGSYTNASGSQTFTWQIKGAKPSPSQKGRLAGTSGVIAPGKTLTVKGTLTMVATATNVVSSWEDLWQGASLEGQWINTKEWKPVRQERKVASIGPGTYAYPYSVKVKIPKKVPKKAITNGKLAKGPLVPGEVLISLFTGACANFCDPDALAPHDDWDELYISIGVLKKR